MLEMFVLDDTDKFSDLFVSFIAEYILPLLVQLIELIEFEQEIGDVSDEALPYMKTIDIKRIDDIESDDLANNLTNFSKDELKEMVFLFGFGDELRISSGKKNAPNKNEPNKYTVHPETALLYTLMKLKGGHTHGWMSDRIFGGSDTRNQHMYRYVLAYLNEKYRDLLGIQGLKKWTRSFPKFAEDICKVVASPRRRVDRNGNVFDEPPVPFNPDEFAIVGFVDCKDWTIEKPGQGPDGDHEGATRKPDAYLQQRSVYSGHHKHHAVRTMALNLPNGLFASVFGPCSSRTHDLTLLQWSDYDDELMVAQQEEFGLNLEHQQQYQKLFKFYGDSAYKGLFHCFRCRYEPGPNAPLTMRQTEENRGMKKVRESIEWNFGKVRQFTLPESSDDS